MDIADRVVLVTGASSGIGEATARLAHERGARVAMVARRAERLDRLVQDLPGSFALTMDVTGESAPAEIVRRTVERFGRVDVLVNNAGRGLNLPVADSGLEQVRSIVELNVVAALRMMQAVVPDMRSRGEGVVVNVSSGTTLMALPGTGVYAATKAALEQFSAVARVELAPDGIVVSTLLPSLTRTEFAGSVEAGESRSYDDLPDDLPFAVQTAEHVAEQILATVASGETGVVLGRDGAQA
ncbi:short-subunit dehydrogenase [Pseudonocardia sediminis]|uniref:Short-subunit dehydrogenase n=1 Tax=Pseudonocardia sediminis TaxID=1397368 RepID=A0A4Q7UWN7_PSEST|nr:SDR family NAD(P)-dependent oxidoreductase [Pseudonocardia sediminis]RZT86382.1 short-subunit dehydrogenase [Pseudonocardia sediminis]